MAATGHTYSPSCLLHTDSNTFTRRASKDSVDPPMIKAHYFYCSALPIDDPLSPVPPPTSATTTKQRLPPRPFSVNDNALLEEAWLSLQDPKRNKSPRRDVSQDVRSKKTVSSAITPLENVAKIINVAREKAPKMSKTGGGDGLMQPLDEGTTTKTLTEVIRSAGSEENTSVVKDKKASRSSKDVGVSAQATEEGARTVHTSATKASQRSTLSEKKSGPCEKKAKDSDKTVKYEDEGQDDGQTPAERNEPTTPLPTPSAGGLFSFGRRAPPAHLKSAQLSATEKLDFDSQEALQGAIKVPQPDLTLCDDPDHIPFDAAMPVGSDEIGNDEFESGLKKKRGRSPFRHSHRKEDKKEHSKAKTEPKTKEASHYRRLSMATQKVHDSKQKSQDPKLGSSPAEHDTTGTPFLRIPSRLSRSRSRSRSREPKNEFVQADGEGATHDGHEKPGSSRPSFQRFFSASQDSGRQDERPRSEQLMDRHFHHEEGHRHFSKERRKPQAAHVAVGVSRLHVVELPSLKMGPIYWDPVHDVSSVVRGTWFYKETLWPVEADVANQIEEGYEYIKPWTSTYVDELNSCQDVGPEAELKLINRLWPADESTGESSKPAADKVKKELLDTAVEQLNFEGQERKNAVAVAGSVPNRAAGVLDGFDDPVRLFSKCSMIYVNAKDAQILRPNQLPSATRGRKPLAAIRKGRPIGIPVVRGFDYRAWEKLYPPHKKSGPNPAQKAPEGSQTGRALINGSSLQDPPCDACISAEERPKPTDLILVIHGIGQKLSERVESFNFTHSINAFRRQVNVELEAETVKPWLRQELGGIMVLPINWRSKIQLEDGRPAPNPNHKGGTDSNKNEFTLRDITEESIPAVRNLISDVLLDIPYYLSHHKPKMIEAVIKEANRVYRLWCINNPGFSENGRVHLLAHSLGSVMTLDILSKQPTKLPKQLDFKSTKVRTDIFEFDTTNLFFAGSPAGLFLYINRSPLLPRKGRSKSDTHGEDLQTGVTGDVGTYGCLAVDNLYNIMHYIDPIAYRLNAAVDVNYAASLQSADVPSTAGTWTQYFGFKGKPAMATPMNKASTGLDSFPARPSAQTMPSTVEMETHNFTREEIAEKRMFLLNDNGQIDYTLRSGGGPLEIQYLNMLGAHSSYWTLQDFTRFLVIEIGRKPGKDQTVASIKAVKKVRSKR